MQIYSGTHLNIWISHWASLLAKINCKVYLIIQFNGERILNAKLARQSVQISEIQYLKNWRQYQNQYEIDINL